MILFLPGNYKTDLNLFHDVFKKRNEFLKELSEVYWVDENSDSEDTDSEVINGIKHSNYSWFPDKNNNTKSLQCIGFYDVINSDIIDLLGIIFTNSVCYYYNYREKRLKIIENLSLFGELYMRLPYFKETLYKNKEADLDIAEANSGYMERHTKVFQPGKNFIHFLTPRKFSLPSF